MLKTTTLSNYLCSNSLKASLNNYCVLVLYMYMLFPGITDLLPEGSSIKAEPLLPGHYESYDLLPSGKVTLSEEGRFHKVGQLPAYRTTEGPLGNHP